MKTAIVSYTDESGNVIHATVHSRTRWTSVYYARYVAELVKLYPEASQVDYAQIVNTARAVQNGVNNGGSESQPADIAGIMDTFSRQNEPLTRLNNIELFANLAACLLSVGDGLPFTVIAGQIPREQIGAAYEHYGNEAEDDGLWWEISKALITMNTADSPVEEAVGTVTDNPLSEKNNGNGASKSKKRSASPLPSG